MSQLLYSRKRWRMLKHKRKLRYLYCVGSKYLGPAYPVDRFGWIDNENPVYYKRVWRGSHSKWLKKQSDRRIRHYKHEISSAAITGEYLIFGMSFIKEGLF